MGPVDGYGPFFYAGGDNALYTDWNGGDNGLWDLGNKENSGTTTNQ